MVGETLLHYRITERLGAGGMGVVWKAIDTHLGREVALKVLPAEDTSDPVSVSRFLREGRSASALNHPNIVTIFEANTAHKIPFIAMEYIRGEGLNETLREGRLSMTRSLDVALQICAALQHAHEHGIVHRDLKPSNIMLTAAGAVKVLDFGLAKRTKAGPFDVDPTITAPLTLAGVTVGTLAYMSPEQAMGEDVDTRSDLFSFGVVLYEMLSGTRPFEGSSLVGAMRRILSAEPAPLHASVPGLPAALEAIVLRCLAKEAQDRYASAADAATDLRQVRSAMAQAAAASTATMMAAPPRPRLPLRRAGIAALLAVLLIICGVFGWRYLPGLYRARAAVAAPSYANEYDAYRAARGWLDRYDKKGNVERAVEALEAAVRLNPNYALGYAGLSEAYLRRNAAKPDPQGQRRAREAADKAVRLNADLAAAHVARGMVLADSRDSSDHLAANGEFGKALDLDPKSSGAYLGLAKAEAAAGHGARAETAYRKAIALATGEWIPLAEFGVFLYRAARYREAAETWEQAQAWAADNVLILTNLGSAYHMLDRYEDAASALQRALEIEPSARIYTNLGTARFFQGRYADAVTAMQKALDLNGGTRSLYWGNLADAYRWAPGQKLKSIDAYRHAIELVRREMQAAPGDSDLCASLAVYLAKAGDGAGAVQQLDVLQKLDNLTANARFQAALAYEILGRRVLALASLEAAIKSGYSYREVRNEPELVSLRADPRFQTLLDRFAGAGSGNPVRR
jgi:serine/threonine-protein kinase